MSGGDRAGSAGDAAAAAGGADAFSELYRAHVGRVYGYLLARTGRPADAEELTSRAFLNAFAQLGSFRGGAGRFGPWLMTIAHHLLVNWYRDRGRRPPTASLDEALAVPASAPGPESSVERTERVRAVRGAVRALPRERQELLALKYVEGLTNAQIGARMGRTEGAVKALHHRTLRQLAATLAEV
jgi:RNA polymerase sigma-70 factor (ECF subfamily)